MQYGMSPSKTVPRIRVFGSIAVDVQQIVAVTLGRATTGRADPPSLLLATGSQVAIDDESAKLLIEFFQESH